MKAINTTCFSVLILVLLVLPSMAQAENFEGFLEPYATIDIAVTETDIVDKLHVKEGDRVEKGQLVAELRKDVLMATLAIAQAAMEAEGQINSAGALAGLHSKRYSKLKTMANDGYAHPEEVRRAQADLSVASSNLRAAKEEQRIHELEYDRILAQIETKNIKSPVNGIVLRIHVDESELIEGHSKAPLMTLVQLDRLKAVFYLPPNLAAKLDNGQAITLNGDDQGAIPGVVEFVDPVVDPESNTVRVKVIVDNQNETVKSGRKVTLEVK